jgi:hypothetical protein
MGTLAYNLSQDRPLWSVVSHYVSVWLRTFTQCYILETTDPSGLLLFSQPIDVGRGTNHTSDISRKQTGGK